MSSTPTDATGAATFTSYGHAFNVAKARLAEDGVTNFDDGDLRLAVVRELPSERAIALFHAWLDDCRNLSPGEADERFLVVLREAGTRVADSYRREHRV